MKKLFVLLMVFTSIYLLSFEFCFAYECDLQNISFSEISEFNYSFNKAYAIDYDENTQLLYIADRDNDRILVLNPEAELDQFQVMFDGLTQPQGVAVDENSNIYVAESGINQVKIYFRKSDGSFFDPIVINENVNNGGIKFEGTYGPIDVFPEIVFEDESSGQYYIYTSELYVRRVRKIQLDISKDNGFLTVNNILLLSEIYLDPSGGPSGIAAINLPDENNVMQGYLFVTYGDSGINKYKLSIEAPDLHSYSLENSIQLPPNSYPAEIAFDSQNNFYVPEHPGFYVNKFDSDLNLLARWTCTISDIAMNQPYGVAVDDNDTIFIGDHKNNRVLKFVPIQDNGEGLVGHWKFDGDATDSSSYGNNGTENGGVSYVDGVCGQAISLDGVNDSILVPDADVLDPSSTQEITILAWVYLPTYDTPISNNYWTIVGKTVTSGRENGAYVLNVVNNGSPPPDTPGQLLFVLYEEPGQTIVSDSVVPLNQWVLVAFTHDVDDNSNFFINGVLAGSHTTVTSTFDNSSHDFRIGYSGAYSDYFYGSIDEVRMYNRALSQAEIQALMNECQPGGTSPIPDTGQTKYYDDVGSEIPPPLSGSPFFGQDAQYPCNPQSYTKLDASGNDLPDEATEWVMVRDNVTGLIWEVKTDDGSIHDRDNTYTWQDSQDTFITTLNATQFGGCDDWRMPAVKELSFIRNLDTYNPAIDLDYFNNTVSSCYWTSDTRTSLTDYAWYVCFSDGNVNTPHKSSLYYVRAVCGEQSTQSLKDNGDGTVTDINNGLMWEQKTIDNKDITYTWQNALTYCEDLILNNDGEWTQGIPNALGAKYEDWHLPDINTLESLVDHNEFDPSINTSLFPNLAPPPTYYWSSTTSSGEPSSAWFNDFYVGDVYYYDKSNTYAVRCVRGRLCTCIDCDGDGYYDAIEGGDCGEIDCDDNDPTTNPGALDLCDGIDNDCDGLIDEDYNVGDFCYLGVGECYAEGIWICTEDGQDTDCNATEGTPSNELCDSKDNDCDSSTDEDFNVGEPCSAGVGECYSEGNYVCSSDGLGTECNAVAGTPSDEICDGLDNNCDDQTDEGLGTTTCGVGECERTVDNCVGGITQECVPGDPTPEACDLLDNNCDGSTDEGLGSTTCGLGVCFHTVQNCVNGVVQVCDPFQDASDEVCDSLDNDCDGLTDEENAIGCVNYYRDEDEDGYGQTLDVKCLCATTGYYTTTQDGDCNDADAEMFPGNSEVCDGKDNNCNGTIDEEDAIGCTVYYRDSDDDTYGITSDYRCLCSPEGDYTTTQDGDCDDTDAAVNPSAVEDCDDGIDNDCDGKEDVSPVIDAITGTVEPTPLGESASVSIAFTDLNGDDTHTATFDWGDGTDPTIVDVISLARTVEEPYTYAQAGVYSVNVTISDGYCVDSSATYQYIVVYDPDGGFVTGGGWIDSPEGAYTPDLTLIGKANFGFVSKYKKGATIPTGETEFQFKVADLNFHSDTYEWLVIAGARAQYKGTGSINGEGNYGFMLTAIDEKLTPSTDIDMFRIKIWDKDNGDVVVYDNQIGDDDDADLDEETTKIGGGSIVIHKSN
jgi:hypothetical protein